MEEFTSYAIWVLVIFLSINSAVVYFSGTDTFNDNSFNPEIDGSTDFSNDDLDAFKNNYQNVNCNTATSSLPDYAFCVIEQLQLTTQKFLGGIWNLLFVWTNLLTAILSPLPGGNFVIGIVVPFFSLIQFGAIFVILMKIAGIIRGGS
jgi:hypothetical protein